MKATLLLNHDENTKQVEEEEKTRFLRNLLQESGVPIEEFWNSDGPLTVDQRIKLRKILSTYNIQVIDDLDGHLQVYVDKEMIGEFFKPTYKLKRDLRQIDPRKQLYLEMTIECNSLFENTDDNNVGD